MCVYTVCGVSDVHICIWGGGGGVQILKYDSTASNDLGHIVNIYTWDVFKIIMLHSPPSIHMFYQLLCPSLWKVQPFRRCFCLFLGSQKEKSRQNILFESYFTISAEHFAAIRFYS